LDIEKPDRMHGSPYEKWHSYRLDKMTYCYFVHNVLLSLRPEYVDSNQALWFPETIPQEPSAYQQSASC
jgi:hypothetical protein